MQKLSLYGLAIGLFVNLWLSGLVPSSQAAPRDQTCLAPALARVTRHTVKSGETIEGIARQYDLIPATLMGMNAVLRNGKAPIGATILIPPYNGIRVEVPSGQRLRDIAARYKVRPDVLFEVNGCQTSPRVVFVPGVNWSPVSEGRSSVTKANPAVLKGYPLPANSTVLLGYGWYLPTGQGKPVFHSGIDLSAVIGSPVLAAGDGVVAFAASQGVYGNLVVINHQQGYQTRYAQLGSIKVKAGQTVNRGQSIATVGSTGTPSSNGPHLHFEVRSNSNLGWVAEDPNPFLRSRP
ncbi:MAG: peptidoglycan DD-metalloendopeptidase family protein [Leptolyngbyaceae cyanobacterium CSU_1_3]|nr:peptidoglycan DD-metalloendopeptidase family protein [Leptolyngbyaceae cyanobacterium CSU_1_3]